MRIHRLIPLNVGLVVASCDDTEGPTEDGRLENVPAGCGVTVRQVCVVSCP